jgi:hypothetical protein
MEITNLPKGRPEFKRFLRKDIQGGCPLQVRPSLNSGPQENKTGLPKRQPLRKRVNRTGFEVLQSCLDPDALLIMNSAGSDLR